MYDYLPSELILKIFSHIDDVNNLYQLLFTFKLETSDKKITRKIIDDAYCNYMITKLKEAGNNPNNNKLRRSSVYSIIGFYPAEKISRRLLKYTIQTKYNPELIRIHITKLNPSEKEITMKYITNMLKDPKSGVLTKIECLKTLKKCDAYQHINEIVEFIDNKSLRIHDYNLVCPVAMDTLSYLSNKYSIETAYYKDKINSLFIDNPKQSPQFLVGILLSLYNYNCLESILFKKIVNFINLYYPYHNVYHPNIIPDEKLIKAYDLQSETSVMAGSYTVLDPSGNLIPNTMTIQLTDDSLPLFHG